MALGQHFTINCSVHRVLLHPSNLFRMSNAVFMIQVWFFNFALVAAQPTSTISHNIDLKSVSTPTPNGSSTTLNMSVLITIMVVLGAFLILLFGFLLVSRLSCPRNHVGMPYRRLAKPLASAPKPAPPYSTELGPNERSFHVELHPIHSNESVNSIIQAPAPAYTLH